MWHYGNCLLFIATCLYKSGQCEGRDGYNGGPVWEYTTSTAGWYELRHGKTGEPQW